MNDLIIRWKLLKELCLSVDADDRNSLEKFREEIGEALTIFENNLNMKLMPNECQSYYHTVYPFGVDVPARLTIELKTTEEFGGWDGTIGYEFANIYDNCGRWDFERKDEWCRELTKKLSLLSVKSYKIYNKLTMDSNTFKLLSSYWKHMTESEIIQRVGCDGVLMGKFIVYVDETLKDRVVISMKDFSEKA